MSEKQAASLIEKLTPIIESQFVGSWAVFRVAAGEFLADVRRTQTSMRASFDARDAAGVSRAAHRLKGETSLFHAEDVTGKMAEIERLARSGRLVEVSVFDEASSSLDRLVEELKLIMKYCPRE